MSYRIRFLRGTLELNFPGRDIETPRAPTQLGTLAVMALNPGREIPLEVFKTRLYDCDPAHVSNAAIQTPIARLRSAGLPIPLRRYVLEVEPAEVDVVDVDIRSRVFIEDAANPERLAPEEIPLMLKEGMALHSVWEEDPVLAVGGGPQFGDLFSAHRKRHRRFGLTLVRLLAASGEYDHALDTLEEYIDSYGEDESSSALEWQLLRWASSGGKRLPAAGDGDRTKAPDTSGARAGAFTEVTQMLEAAKHHDLSELIVSSHNMDLVYAVDHVVVADDQVRIDTPVESPGGSGANTGVGLARLGLNVAVAGIIAADRQGAILRRDFVQEGVDHTNLLTVKAGRWRTGHAHIFTGRDGRRATYIHPGINEHWAQVVQAKPGGLELLRSTARRARIVHFSSFYGHAERDLQQELVAGLSDDTVVSFDPGTMYSPMGLDRLAVFTLRCNILQIYDHQLHALVANSSAEPQGVYGRHSARANLEAMLRWRSSRGSRHPLVALVKKHRAPGDDGNEPHGFEAVTLAAGRNAVEELVSPQAPTGLTPALLDTTGAGDAMATGLHYGLLHSAPPADCVDLAYVVAMACSSDYGCRAGLIPRARLPDAWDRHMPAADLPPWLSPYRRDIHAGPEGARNPAIHLQLGSAVDLRPAEDRGH